MGQVAWNKLCDDVMMMKLRLSKKHRRKGGTWVNVWKFPTMDSDIRMASGRLFQARRGPTTAKACSSSVAKHFTVFRAWLWRTETETPCMHSKELFHSIGEAICINRHHEYASRQNTKVCTFIKTVIRMMKAQQMNSEKIILKIKIKQFRHSFNFYTPF